MIEFTDAQIEKFLVLKLRKADAEGELVGDFVVTTLTVPEGVLNSLSMDVVGRLESRLKGLGWKAERKLAPGPYVYRINVPKSFADDEA